MRRSFKCLHDSRVYLCETDDTDFVRILALDTNPDALANVDFDLDWSADSNDGNNVLDFWSKVINWYLVEVADVL